MKVPKVFYTILVLIVILVPTIILSTAGIILSIFSKKLAHYCEKIYFKLILILSFTKVSVIGKENIPKNKNYVIISNHQSAFDIIVLSGALPLQIRWVSKESIFKIPFIGQFMKAMGYISLPREQLKKSTQTLIKETKNIDGFPTIFPEGTRSEDGKIKSFKRGFLLLSEELDLGILPIVIKGTRDVMKKNELIITPFQKVIVKILPPIERETIKNLEDQKEFTKKVEDLMRKELSLLDDTFLTGS